MSTNKIYIAHPANSEQVTALEAFMKALKIKFEVKKKSPYDPEFVTMIKQDEEDLKNGKGIKMTLDELENLCK